MMLKNFLLAVTAFLSMAAFAQKRPITIQDIQKGNRLLLFAVNENEQDFDVLLTVEGSGFRQPKGKARWVRVPATSKVNVKSLIIERGQKPKYTYELVANDSLSKRALKNPFELIKVEPKKKIVIYLTANCSNCDQLILDLDASIYKYTKKLLSEEPKTLEYLKKAFEKSTTPFETISNPIVNINGTYYGDIDNYESLMQIVNQE